MKRNQTDFLVGHHSPALGGKGIYSYGEVDFLVASLLSKDNYIRMSTPPLHLILREKSSTRILNRR